MVHPAQGQMVQDIAAAGDLTAPPRRYVLREEDRPATTAGAVAAIPTVDMNRLGEPGDADADVEATKLRAALQSWGLFAVTGHGMPEPFLDEILAATRGFFHLPPEEKERYSNVVVANDGDGGGERFQAEGYGVDRVDTDEQILDWCDRLYLQVQPEEERRLEFWPEHPAALRGLLEEYTRRSEQVFRRPHTDNSVLTVLLLDKHVGGLQLLKDGRWLDIPALTHELLVVAGEEIEIMSNGVFMAPVHRVVTSERERVSVVMFYQPEPHKDLAPSEELVGEERPALYKKIKAKDFGDGVWDAFAAGERTIDMLKVKIEQEEEAEEANVSNTYL
uniref:Fe2OG dioxygenase domain-containing protein n=1 Tax=Oryza barthii TaxID=65489 RepID=A0A0D3GDF1_9ORYZ